jgi:hypothetical protein
MICDRSYKKGVGTVAWVIQGRVFPGSSDLQYAYRSELAWLHPVISIINDLCSQHDIYTGSIEIGCDRLSAVQTIQKIA